MMTIPAGHAVFELIRLAFAAMVPVMLHGLHGIGKSQILEAAANAMNIGFISRG